MQVQVMLRLYTMLLPNLRQAALRSRPTWAIPASPSPAAIEQLDASQAAVIAIIRQEAAAVLNVGQRLHSEGRLATPAPAAAPSPKNPLPSSIPLSPILATSSLHLDATWNMHLKAASILCRHCALTQQQRFCPAPVSTALALEQ